MGGSASRPVSTTEKSFQIMELINNNGPMRLSEISAEFEESTSTIYRHLNTLEDLGYITGNENGYELGLWLLDLGLTSRNRNDLYNVGKSSAEALAAETETSVWLTTEENGLGVHLHKAVGGHEFQTFSTVGKRRPLHALAGGKAILAHLPEQRVSDILDECGLTPVTNQTITDPETLFEELETIRQNGCAFQFGEGAVDVNGVGAPIIIDDEVIGAIAASGTASDLLGSKLEDELANRVRNAATEIEIGLRYAE